MLDLYAAIRSAAHPRPSRLQSSRPRDMTRADPGRSGPRRTSMIRASSWTSTFRSERTCRCTTRAGGRSSAHWRACSRTASYTRRRTAAHSSEIGLCTPIPSHHSQHFSNTSGRIRTIGNRTRTLRLPTLRVCANARRLIWDRHSAETPKDYFMPNYEDLTIPTQDHNTIHAWLIKRRWAHTRVRTSHPHVVYPRAHVRTHMWWWCLW